MKALASIPEPVQIDMLVQTAEQMLEDPLLLDRMVADWQEGDVEGLADFLAEDDVFGDGPAYDIMLDGRNANWTETIARLLDEEEGVFFVAVGALHLVGEDSLQVKLRQRGLDVVRVDRKNEILR